MKYLLFTLIFVASLTSCNESTAPANTNSNNQSGTQAPAQTPPNNNVQGNEIQKAVEKPNLTWEQLYPILKNNLLQTTCEPCYIAEETEKTFNLNSTESDGFLSGWDFNKNDLKIADIDGDGLVDYTIEMLDQGAGCGGNLGFYERWTLFGSNPSIFINTHVTTTESGNEKWVTVN
jgi:hypothetical protein